MVAASDVTADHLGDRPVPQPHSLIQPDNDHVKGQVAGVRLPRTASWPQGDGLYRTRFLGQWRGQSRAYPHTVNIEGDSYWLREKKKFSRLGRKPKLAVELEEEVGTEA